MSPPQHRIRSVGLHVLYEPEKSGSTLVDIVFVHGFGGHPMRSWQYEDRISPDTRLTAIPPARDGHLKNLLRTARSSNKTDRSNIEAAITQKDAWRADSNVLPQVFWPRDFLPMACPEARIMTWGYHTLHSGNMPITAQLDLFARVRELLRDLRDLRRDDGVQTRPLIFIAHSLGGMIVKEALREAEFSNIATQQDILSSTAAVVFFGCPHRVVGKTSPIDTAMAMAEETQSIRTDRSVLSGLCGVNNPRWKEAQDSFVQQWHHFNFRVKTYQERQGGKSKFINTRVESTKLDDAREEAESLPAGHRMMCQFRSVNDAGFKSLSRILQGMVKIEKLKRQGLSVDEIHCLRLLDNRRVHDPQSSKGYALDACRAIYSSREFRNWYRRQGGSNEYILWLTGTPGSGKSTQLRYLKRQMEKYWKPGTASIVYCIAEGLGTDRDSVPEPRIGNLRSVNVIRSILSQLFGQDPSLRQRLSSSCRDGLSDVDITRFFLEDYVVNKPQALARRTFILVDVEDSCDDPYIRELLHCLCPLAQNSSFSICLASRLIDGCPPANIIHLQLDNYNYEEIIRFTESRLKASWEERIVTVHKVAEKAGGSFLWAQFATNLLQDIIDNGGTQDLVNKVLEALPTNLYGLYELTLASLSSKEKADATTIMRWVMLSPEPMLLNDLQMAVRLSRTRSLLLCEPETALHVGSPLSMQELKKKGKQFDTPSQFYQWLCSRTRGLLEARPVGDEGKAQQPLGLQRIHPIHESVRLFFLSGRGFAALCLGRAKTAKRCNHEAVHLCHYSLLHTILIYLNTSDLSPLVSGTLSQEPAQTMLSSQTSPTWRRNVVDQRNLITSSYPFLRYAVDNLLYHLLSPRPVRYFLPQHAIFAMFTANECRIWRRWTALLGETDASAILAKCASAEALLQPEFGASFRLERVLRAVNRMATGDSWFSPQKRLRLSVYPFPVPPGSGKSRTEEGEGEAVQHVPIVTLRPPSPPRSPRLIRRGARSRGTVIIGTAKR
ncbi:hypothetical protein F5B22DRAFT_224984 [Xylaria bambusicola]|uniref:uncharacterized protein n=1 Tax=Xylaria bambusicola TaxID=326684 RepID=UPI0020087659|nr:uncharacterized protein F5B22DRAFT_224984 [Xylaria bambusicola]KAI0514616.1 hypothetical protein F5B22DRAFT_224984 [Xylaria bambusicola]